MFVSTRLESAWIAWLQFWGDDIIAIGEYRIFATRDFANSANIANQVLRSSHLVSSVSHSGSS
jgi:hypothetical protein